MILIIHILVIMMNLSKKSIELENFYTKKEIADDMLKRGLVPFLKNDNSGKDGL